MALTLLEASKLDPGDIIRNGIIEEFVRRSNILQFLPIIDIPGNAISYNRTRALPSVGFRAINEAFTESSGVLEPQTEALKIFGGDLDADTFLVNTTPNNDIRTAHEGLKLQAMSWSFNRTFIKGDSHADPRVFDGLQARLSGDQVLDAGNTSGGDPLSLAALDELLDAVIRPTHLIMNAAMRRRLTAAARNASVGGQIDMMLDNFGQQITTYAGLPIIILEADNVGQEVLPFSEENPGGGTPSSTSIYCVSMGDGALAGIQGSINGVPGVSVRDLGEGEGKPTLRTRFEWYCSLVTFNSRCAARLRGITNAPAVA